MTANLYERTSRSSTATRSALANIHSWRQVTSAEQFERGMNEGPSDAELSAASTAYLENWKRSYGQRDT
jgi:hypothetical protein